jgi:ABC-type polysaccharide/polyol phosphate export permease
VRCGSSGQGVLFEPLDPRRYTAPGAFHLATDGCISRLSRVRKANINGRAAAVFPPQPRACDEVPTLRAHRSTVTSGRFGEKMDTATHMLRTGRRGTLFEFNMAFQDLRNSVRRLSLAWSLAWHDVVSRYRGSILGPFWITISMGLMVLGIGVVYANLFGIALEEFLPLVALGIVFFGTISGIITEGCDTFVQASSMLSQTNLPMFTFIWRTVLRNLINLAHHLVIVVAVIIFYGYWRQMNPLGAFVGLVFLVANAAWLSMLVAIASARFRDIPQVVTSIMQFAIFVTPVFWPAERLKGAHLVVLDFNPFYHMLEAVRAPLLGLPIAAHTYSVLAIMALVGWSLVFSLFAVTRRRIVHYL